MKILYILSLIILFFSCTKSVKKEIDGKTKNSILNSSKYGMGKSIDNCKEDSLVKMILKNGRKDLQVGEMVPKPNISFSSGYTDSFSSKENNIEFIDTVYEKNRSKIDNRSTYLNDIRLNVCSVNNDKLVVDSMEMQIIYTESEIYTFDNRASYVLIVSKPMNWV